MARAEASNDGPRPDSPRDQLKLGAVGQFPANIACADEAGHLTPLLDKVDQWLRGHVYDSFDYRLGKCRRAANPAG